MTAIEVCGNDEVYKRWPADGTESLVSKRLVGERGLTDVLCYSFFVFDGLHTLFIINQRLWTLNLPKREKLYLALP